MLLVPQGLEWWSTAPGTPVFTALLGYAPISGTNGRRCIARAGVCCRFGFGIDRQSEGERGALARFTRHFDRKTLEIISQALAGVISGISARLPVEKPEQAETNIDTGELRKVCNKLAAELAALDFASGDTFDEHESLMRAALGDRHAAIRTAIHDSDFELARALLQDAVASHGIEL